MPAISNRLALSRRSLITIAVVVVALFAIANLTAKNSSHPGTVSNVAFAVFVIGGLLLVVTAIASFVHSRRRQA